jgi:O-antigen/teichoic acid export membrane protein
VIPTPNSVTRPLHPIVGTAVASAAIMACGLITGVIAARSLGPEGRGQLAAITVWSMTILYAGTLGVPEAVAYFAAAGRESRDRVWMTGQAAALALGVLVTLAGWSVIPFIFTGEQAALVPAARWYLSLFVIPGLGALCATAWLQGVGRMRAFNISRTAVHVVSALGMAMLMVTGDRAVVHFAAVLLLGNATPWLLATAAGPIRRVVAAPPSARVARDMLRYGVRVQFGNWSNAANVRLDQLLLSLVASSASLGLYVVAVSYASVLLAIPATAVYPMLPEIAAEHRKGTARACLVRWYRRLLWMTILGAVVLAVCSVTVVPLAFGSAFSSAVLIAVLLLPGTVMLGMNGVLSTAFRAIGHPEIGSTSEVIGLAITVPVLAALLPMYGLYGVVLASILAYGASHVYLIRRTMTIFGLDFKTLLRPTGEDFILLRNVSLWKTHGAATAIDQSVSPEKL